MIFMSSILTCSDQISTDKRFNLFWTLIAHLYFIEVSTRIENFQKYVKKKFTLCILRIIFL